MDDVAERWQKCQADWLNELERRSGRGNTRRAYAHDVRGLLESISVDLWEVTSADAEAWVQQLSTAGHSSATINRKIAALSSLFRYATTYPSGIDGRPLWEKMNPFARRALRRRSGQPAVSFPTTEQVRDLLAEIQTDTAVGLRNLAIIAGMVATTRRISEWLPLRAGDVHHAGRYHWFEYRSKGGGRKRQELSDAIWQIVERYLRLAGRWPLGADDYLFVALSANGERLQAAKSATLNPGYVTRLIKRYGRKAGVPEECLYPHALRHAGAQARREQGADVLDLQRAMGHSSPATTAGYLRRMEHPRDPQVDVIDDLLPRGARAR